MKKLETVSPNILIMNKKRKTFNAVSACIPRCEKQVSNMLDLQVQDQGFQPCTGKRRATDDDDDAPQGKTKKIVVPMSLKDLEINFSV